MPPAVAAAVLEEAHPVGVAVLLTLRRRGRHPRREADVALEPSSRPPPRAVVVGQTVAWVVGSGAATVAVSQPTAGAPLEGVSVEGLPLPR